MRENNYRNERMSVMVRSWGDEPVKLFLYRIETERSYVGSAMAKHPIGLPHDQVFAFDLEKFTNLLTAFQQMDRRKLGEFWANMTVDDFACNRYQDMLSSVHDQERVANPESSPRSNVG